MDNIKGRVIGLVLANVKGLDMAGHDALVHKSSFFARIVGFDVFGLWAESRYRGLKTHVYFPWGNIKSIIYFPDKTDLEADDQKRCLGFGCRAEKTEKLPRVNGHNGYHTIATRRTSSQRKHVKAHRGHAKSAKR